ncbi:MAG TPA: oligopeptide/dipeptide ABC transporter ATP-binding protein, partial [Fimbriimonas sp.]|nr:oligopeptide/dipeptide ABC transporter ATP-binding protein [Fimbriimonas sp.]
SIAGQPPDFSKLDGSCSFADRCLLRTAQCSEEPPLTDVAAGHKCACWRAAEVRSLEFGQGLTELVVGV